VVRAPLSSAVRCRKGEPALKTAQIRLCGELLVQYLLLLRGVESAPMSTDAGVDLVAYSPKTVVPLTIQVKTNLKAKPGGGKGKYSLDWWLPEDTPAQLAALVDLSSQRVWMFKAAEVPALAQQKSGGRFHLYMTIDPTLKPRKLDRLSFAYEFEMACHS
jgi:hypothetical protein